MRTPLSVVIPSALLLLAACSKDSSNTAKGTSSELVAQMWEMSSHSAEAKKHMEAGENFADRGRGRKAFEEFKLAVAADSAFGFAYLRVAQFANSLDEHRINLQRAAAYVSTANAAEKLMIESQNKVFARNAQGAVDDIQQLVKLQPANPRAWWQLALIQAGAGGNVPASREAAKKMVEIAPKNPDGPLYLSYLYTLEPGSDTVVAEKYLQQGLALWPKEPITHDLLGDLRRTQGRLAEAAEAYARQIELDPQESEGYNQRGYVNAFLGNYAQARADYDAAIRKAKGNAAADIARNRAYVSAYAGDLPTSVKELQQLVAAIDGMNVPDAEGAKINTLISISTLATEARLFEVAEKANTESFGLMMKAGERVSTPEFLRGTKASVAYGEARLAIFKGDYAIADRKIVEYTKLIEADRRPTKFRPLHALKGFELLFQKKYEEALKEFEQSSPNDVHVWYRRAQALEGLGRTAEAKALYAKVATLNRNSAIYAAIRRAAVAKSTSL